MDRISVVIIGGTHHNTLGVIRSIGEAGISRDDITVLIVGINISKNNIISTSKYVKKSNIFYLAEDKDITPCLIEISKDGIVRVVICCADGATEEVISNTNKLKNMYHIPKTVINISRLMNKEEQGRLAKECGFLIPEGMIINKKNIKNWNLFPCITKPLKSINGAGKLDIHISNDIFELEYNLKNTESERVQVQCFLKKKMEYQLIGCSLDSGKEIIIPGFTKIERQPDNTNTGYLVYCSIDKLKFDYSLVKDFIRTIGYSGLFSIECIRDYSNRDYYLEINLRNDGNAYCVQSAGVNLPYIWCYYETFGVLPDLKMTVDRDIWFIPDFNDLKIALKEVGFIRWLKDFISADSHTIYNRKDIKPFLYEIFRLIKKI